MTTEHDRLKAMADALADDVEAFLETVEVPTSGYGYTMWSKLRRTLQSYRAQAEEPKVLPGVGTTGFEGRWIVAFTLPTGTSRQDVCATDADLIRSVVHGVGLTGEVKITQFHRRPITPDAR